MVSANNKGRTRWFPRSEAPVRHGRYECTVRVSSSVPPLMWGLLEWDGTGFLVPMPMVVLQWRGLTRRAAARSPC